MIILVILVASKSLSLSRSGYFGDVNSCLWVVNVAHAHSMRMVELDLDCVCEGDELAEVFDFPSVVRISKFIP